MRVVVMVEDVKVIVAGSDNESDDGCGGECDSGWR